MPLVNVTLPWYHAVLHKKLTVLKKMMLRAFYAVCDVLLSLISFALTRTSCWTASGSFQYTL